MHCDWLPDKWVDIIPSSVEESNATKNFNIIIEIIAGEGCTYKYTINPEGNIVKGL